MARPARARIDLSAIRHNYRHAKSLAPHAKAVAIIKANAYGHGAVRVAQALAAEADAFGVACIEEAIELREAGIQNPIMLLEGIFTADELDTVDVMDFMMAVHTKEQVEWIAQAKPAKPFTVWLKVDTGMHRLGFHPDEAASVYQQLNVCDSVGEVTLMTHFARADEPNVDATALQVQRFKQATKGIDAPVAMANSAGLLVWDMTRKDWLRPGIMLYGSSPVVDDQAITEALKPAMSLESALIAVRELEVGESIGYGARFTCDKPTRVGVVAMGYADGYPRHAADGTPVAVNGVRTRIMGRVSMDMLTVDLTDLPDAKVGDPVELWGTTVLANEVAACSDTISYTLFTGVTRRVPLIYSDEA